MSESKISLEQPIYSFNCPNCGEILFLDTLEFHGGDKCYKCSVQLELVLRAVE